jgi:hypothetical protein
MGGEHLSMDTVIELGLKLPDVQETLYYGFRALKLNGRMLACTPVNKSAEINSAVVSMGFDQRAALLKKHPSLYYLTDHYAPHPTILVRLSKIPPAELEQTLRMAWDFISSEGAVRRARGKAKPRSVRRVLVRPKS